MAPNLIQQNAINLTLPVPTTQGGTGLTSFSTGQLLIGNGSGLTPLPPGSNGLILTADSTQALGLGWQVLQPPAAPTLSPQSDFGTPFTITESAGTYTLNIVGGQGNVVFSRDNKLRIVNTRQTTSNASIASSGGTATNGFSYQVKNTTSTPYAITLTYVISNTGETGVYSEEVQFYSSSSGTYSILAQDHAIQFGNQLVPVNGHLISNNPGDSITLRMGALRDVWFVTQSVGTWTISQT